MNFFKNRVEHKPEAVPVASEDERERPTVETLHRFFDGLAKVVVNVLEIVVTAIQNAEPKLAAMGAKDWPDLLRLLDELPMKSKDAMRRALAQGWFFGWHDGLGSLTGLVERLAAAPDDAFDELMIDYYRANLLSFTEHLTANHPARSLAIKAAVDAHMSISNSGYYLSVPVFIIQADGILAEITLEEQPLRDGAEAIRGKYAMDPELLDLLYPFLELKNSPFTMSSKKRRELATGDWLNRHEVIHGERSDYGTERNSLKAFSFLVFAGLHMPAVIPKER
jgi:hypothetical protein